MVGACSCWAPLGGSVDGAFSPVTIEYIKAPMNTTPTAILVFGAVTFAG